MWSGILWFQFAFPSWLIMLSIFSHACRRFMYLFWKTVYSDTLFIFKLGYLSFCNWVVRILYIIWTQVPYQIYNLQTFSLILWVVSTFFMKSFETKKFFTFHKVQLIYFFATGVISKKPLPNPRSWRFTPILSVKNFKVLALTFSSLIHFVLIFVCGMRLGIQLHVFCIRTLIPFYF